MNQETVLKIAKVDDAICSHAAEYYHSRSFFHVPDEAAKIQLPYDIIDHFLLGALTNSDLLLACQTGTGKSHLSRMVMNGLYGEKGFTNLTVTPGLSESDFIDIDVPGIKEGRMTLKEAVQTTPLLTRPGTVVNEINRTPEILQNIFISYLERIFSLKGIEFPVGVPFDKEKDTPQDAHYQFRVISINEGADYSGTSGIDRAVRDRIVIEVPLDQFRPRKEDVRQMVKTRNDAGLAVSRTNGGRLEDIVALVHDLETIPLSLAAEEFLVYLSGLSNCILSQTHSKRGISFTSKLCEGCHHAKSADSDKGNICGSVYDPSGRSIINAKKISRAVAALRAYKVVDAISRGELDKDQKFIKRYLPGLQVTLDDITGIAPYILTSKLLIDPRWVAQHFQGSKFNATTYIVNIARQRFASYVRSPVYSALIESDGAITPEVATKLEKYAREQDAWAYNLGDLMPGSYVQIRTPAQRKVGLGELL